MCAWSTWLQHCHLASLGIIHLDQNGFLPKRLIKHNLRFILDTLEYYETHPEKQMALIFLDAQKAFDNVSWQFMIHQLYGLWRRIHKCN